jgi:hypothetical protein
MLMFCAAGASAGGPAAYTCEGGYFSITIPAGWSQMPPGGLPAKSKKVYGVDLLLPSGKGPAASITVKYYAPGNSVFKTGQDYVDSNSQPFGKPEPGEKYSSVMSAAVSGRKAYRFERKFNLYDLPRTVPPTSTAMFERHIVVPAKEGFYVLLFSAQFTEGKTLMPQFDAVLKSFKPASPKR